MPPRLGCPVSPPQSNVAEPAAARKRGARGEASLQQLTAGQMRGDASGCIRYPQVILPLAETPASMLMLVQPRRRK